MEITQRLNAGYRGSSGNTKNINTSQVLLGNCTYLIDTTSAAFTVYLPQAPANGTVVRIINPNSSFATNNLTVSKSGSDTIAGSATIVLSENNKIVDFLYASLLGKWVHSNNNLTSVSGIVAGGELSGTYPNPTVLNSAVIGKVLTGYTSGAGTISSSDTILQAIQKLNGNTIALTSSGTNNYISKFSSGSLINSSIFDNGSFVGFRQNVNNYNADFVFKSSNSNQVVLMNDVNQQGHTRLLIKEIINSCDIDIYSYQAEANIGTVNSHPLLLRTGGTTRAKIFANGRWGINTTTDSGYQFDVNGTGRFANNVTIVGQVFYPNVGNQTFLVTYTSNQDKGITYFYQAQNFPASNSYTRIFDIVSSGDSAGGGAIRFLTSPANSASSTTMYLSPSGNVGINTTTDAGYKLDVNGTGRFTGALTIGSTTASTSTTTGALIVSGGVGIAGALYTGNGIVNATGSVYLPNSTSIYFRNAANSTYLRALRFASDNNVVIGEDSNVTYLSSNYIGLGTGSVWSKVTIGGGNVTLLNNIRIQGVNAAASTFFGLIKVATDDRVYINEDNREAIIGGNTGIGITPTAVLHLKAGTATANTAPLKFTTSGSVILTTPEAGVMEVDSSGILYYTPSSIRQTVFAGNDGATAPSTAAFTVATNFYGSSMTSILGTPNSWASVIVNGTTYKIPLYL